MTPPLYTVAAALLLLLCGLGLPSPAAGEVGVNATHIVVGQTAPLTGLLSGYGIRLSAGLRVAFSEVNAAGGVQGRNLSLLVLDDQYTYALAQKNFLALQNCSLLLAAVCGSSINDQLLPQVVAAGIPSMGPWTGSSMMRSPFYEQVVNVRASYADEMVVQAILLVKQLRVSRIACFYQNDDFGMSVLTGITNALHHVGMQLTLAASYNVTTVLNIEDPYEAIAGLPHPAQAVVMGSLEDANVNFIRRFLNDNRTDHSCVFLIISNGVTSSFPTKLEAQYWPNLYFTQVMPPLNTPGLSIVSEFKTAAALYLPSGLTADPLSFEGYMVGQLIAQVLQGIPREITRQSFLDQLFNTRLYAFGGLLAGLYSRNFSGCDKIVCGSNVGLRAVFPARLDPATGTMHYNDSLGYYSYPVTELSFPVTEVVRPLLFAQLLPLDDPVWQKAAEAIGHAVLASLATFNAAGGVNGRPVELIQQYYSGDPAPAAAALADRYPLLAFVGSVVNCSQALRTVGVQIGTFQTDPLATYAPYNFTEVAVQTSLALELMALAAFAQQLGLPVHFRAPATSAGETALQVMVQSLNTLQQQPASAVTYTSAAEALQGVGSGAVIAVGTDADVQAWFLALASQPQLRLLVPSQRAVHLQGTLDVTDYPQANRFHYPYMFSPDTLPVIAGPEINDTVLYGQLLAAVFATVLAKAGNVSLAYTTIPQVLNAWYGSQYRYDGVTLGPYYSAACSATTSDCECNEGVRQVTVLTATRQELPAVFTFAISTCRVQYSALIILPGEGQWYIWVIVGVVSGVVVFGVLGWWLACRGRRDNAAAPKNSDEPFCILFTDIQSSTNLWATVPDVMANALHVHHTLVRKLLVKHKLYEVKTIGDSFMCATRSPAHAVEFAIALQRELFEFDWGTNAIDTAYYLQQDGEKGRWSGSHSGWNGLRVRVGIHYGLGSVHLDPVSKGYDYYGTVVNTASRVEAVCHGGQIGITQAVHDAMNGEFPGAVVTDLGKQILRGLAEPVHLYQLVPWELSERTFPNLRLEYAAAMEVERRAPTERSVPRRGGRGFPLGSPNHSGGPPTAARTTLMGAPTWVESHPMVSSGQLSAEDVTVRYFTVQKALTTLLETQTPRVREMVLHAFCERLQVRCFGSEGARLEDAIHGLVQRVLPSALTAVRTAPRRGSKGSCCISSVLPADYYSLDGNTLGPHSPASERLPGGLLSPSQGMPIVEDV